MAFQFNSLSKKQQMAVILGVPGIIAIVLVWLIYQKLGVLGPDPAFASIPMFQRQAPGNLWGQINDKQGEIDQKDQVIARRKIRQIELAGLEGEIATARDMLPRDKEVLEIVQKLSELARQIPSDVGTVKIGPVNLPAGRTVAAGKTAKKNELPQIVFELELDGDINGIIKYVDSIEKLRRYMAVTNLSIKPGKITADKGAQDVRYGPHHARLTLISFTYTPIKTGGK